MASHEVVIRPYGENHRYQQSQGKLRKNLIIPVRNHVTTEVESWTVRTHTQIDLKLRSHKVITTVGSHEASNKCVEDEIRNKNIKGYRSRGSVQKEGQCSKRRVFNSFLEIEANVTWSKFCSLFQSLAQFDVTEHKPYLSVL